VEEREGSCRSDGDGGFMVDVSDGCCGRGNGVEDWERGCGMALFRFGWFLDIPVYSNLTNGHLND